MHRGAQGTTIVDARAVSSRVGNVYSTVRNGPATHERPEAPRTTLAEATRYDVVKSFWVPEEYFQVHNDLGGTRGC